MPTISRSSSSTSHPTINNNNINSPSSISLSSETRSTSNTGSSTTAGGDQQQDESNKFKQLLSVLKKAIGVKDMGAMRLSLPAHLITPIGNLEYWCYLDRPDFFAAIDHSDDDFERMLAVLRWTLTKESKFVHGPVCKPYNSVLGEQFRCLYDVIPTKIDEEKGTLQIYEETLERSNSSSNESSLKSESSRSKEKTRVVFLNEQVSHHPPISCFWYEARPLKQNSNHPTVIAHGVDQISAKFTGTSVKVFPGPMNKGIFIKLPNRNEEYHITHPTATVTGLIRANPYVVITDYAYITCRSSDPKRRFRTMISYVDESWVGKAKFALEGIIYEILESDSEEAEEWSKMKQVPIERIWCKFNGSWRGVVNYTLTQSSNSSKERELIDLSRLKPIDKTVKDVDHQTSMESRKFWKPLTDLILSKNFAEATQIKQSIEQDQRDLSIERKSTNQPFKPVIFDIDDDLPLEEEEGEESKDRFGSLGYVRFSKPCLSDDGRKILENEFDGIGY
ncbi:hypothetical protein MJO28_013410 [Puccinia striiformis f. sp. tritici]|uniref:Oxysterol-binding protein n=3 Tax=Puccinia striiformis f. sp. tritici TaxID=168172 RepID=A0A0L0UVL0_9BASI|nr:hypothetical protein Pst134EB_024831 [Puccinia striiformis f. sp. tritici]KAI7941125.1 hypothetical protein MJO28_013410 [Puccinia striiformis f. sp. tritici]KAI7942841.1 hypothetical protein MJO29_012685 [Puccinia striiformis f. sp. tritici]KAI9606600.1 hypothetical protein H4Q26_006136 [Puccinia striiformis f. sp. tritici PST-130]KNE90794.1 hypothetical protein PSTG_15761 [Puccinia striiformis f. sp. tritici PST-78]